MEALPTAAVNPVPEGGPRRSRSAAPRVGGAPSAGQIAAMKITALDHIAIATPNLDESLKMFEQALGIRCEHVEELPERGIKVAFLPVGNTRIELVTPMREGSEVSAFLEKRGGGIHHIALRTDDVDRGVAELKAKGVKMAQDPSPGAHGCRVAFVHPKATGGVLLELSTPPHDH